MKQTDHIIPKETRAQTFARWNRDQDQAIEDMQSILQIRGSIALDEIAIEFMCWQEENGHVN